MSNFIPGAGVVIAYSCSRETYNTYDFSAGVGGGRCPYPPVCLFVCVDSLRPGKNFQSCWD